jgi:histidyl-tRNA synthetase
MENLSTLLGKYGEEGDKLLFKILNSGDFLSEVRSGDIKEMDTNKLSVKLCEKGLRYDLTVPFARYVVQHRNEIVFPFRRYQMQPVWRADRPQKGRYREFYQCDVDVIGSNSLLNEVEVIQIVDEVFNAENLNTKVLIKINNRKILSGIAEIIGEKDKIIDITVAIDKLDKIGLDKVNEELAQKGITTEAIEKIQPIIKLQGSNDAKISDLKNVLAASETGMKGIAEIEKVFEYIAPLSIQTQVEFDITLARGLNYYTGAIFEVKALEAEIGSICGGGRYDDLTGIFGLKDVSGVGVSFGADRIYDVLLQLDRYPKESSNTTKILFVNFGVTEERYCLNLVEKVRKAGINAELYPDHAKMKKQFDYANARNIPYVAIIGDNEIAENNVVLKNMLTGEQAKYSIEEVIKTISV